MATGQTFKDFLEFMCKVNGENNWYEPNSRKIAAKVVIVYWVKRSDAVLRLPVAYSISLINVGSGSTCWLVSQNLVFGEFLNISQRTVICVLKVKYQLAKVP
jgi:hypothetical protein